MLGSVSSRSVPGATLGGLCCHQPAISMALLPQLTEVQELEGHSDRVWSVAWSPAGDMLASCSGDRTVRVWSCQRGSDAWRCSAELAEGHTGTVRSVSWAPRGDLLACSSFDSTTSIWQIQGGVWEQVATLEGHENEVKCVAWSSSGTLLATCGRDKSVWIWESMPGNEYECVDVKQGHKADVKVVAWHPGGEVLASGSYDNSIKLWRDTGDEWECAQSLEVIKARLGRDGGQYRPYLFKGPGIGHTSTVWGVNFDHSGSSMASCSDDCQVKVWECTVSGGQPHCRLASTLTGYHSRTIFSVDWSAAGALATGAADNAIAVFTQRSPAAADGDAEQQRGYELSVKKEQAHLGDVNCVRWHPTDPTLLASAGDEGTVKLWRFSAST